MWCDQQKSCDQSPVSPWVIFFYYNTHLNGPCRINQRHIHGHLPWFVIWIWLLVCLFFIPKTMALSWCKNPKLWNTDLFMQRTWYTSKSAHNLLCWCFNVFKSYQWMKLYILAFTLSVGVWFRVYIRYKVVYLGLTSYIAWLLPGLK